MRLCNRIAAGFAAESLIGSVSCFWEFLKNYRKRITWFVIYQMISWVYDNPIWWFVELRWKEDGILALMVGAVFINAGILIHNRRKKVSWLGFDAAAELLVEKVEEITAMFFTLTSPGIVLVLFSSTLFSSDPIKCIQGLLVFFILFESVIIFGQMVNTRWGDVVAFFLLSFWQDSFITTAYLRHGRKNGLEAKDWIIFALSSATSIIYWTIRNGLIAEFVLRPMLKI